MQLISILLCCIFSVSNIHAQSIDTLSKQQSTQEIVFEKVDVKPSIEYAAWRQHLEASLQPIVDTAAALGIAAGKHVVKVRFIVEKDGSITNVKVIEDPGYGLGKGAEQIILSSPKWTPAKKNGKKVRSFYIQPIGFVIEEE